MQDGAFDEQKTVEPVVMTNEKPPWEVFNDYQNALQEAIESNPIIKVLNKDH